MRTFGGDPNAVMKCYKLSKLKRSAEIVTVFDGSMSLLTSAGIYSGYSGQPYYRPRQNIPVVDLIVKNDVNWGQSFLIADWKRTSYKADQSVDMSPVSAQAGTPPISSVNKDLENNDGNFRFRHGKNNDTMNALFGDGHVSSFFASKNQLAPRTSPPPNGGSLKYVNVFIERPRVSDRS